MAERSRTEISTELLQELRRRAQEQGRPEGELLEEAVRRYLERPGSLSELFERIRTRAAGARRRAALRRGGHEARRRGAARLEAGEARAG